MTRKQDITDAAARIEAQIRGKARAEIGQAEALLADRPAIENAGDELADVLLLKGEPGLADRREGRVLSGPDGVAARKALDALGLPDSRYASCTRAADVSEDVRRERLRLLIEAVDPRTIVALDLVAARDLADAAGLPEIKPGVLLRWRGRAIVVVEGLEASLTDARLKRRVWKQFKALLEARDLMPRRAHGP